MKPVIRASICTEKKKQGSKTYGPENEEIMLIKIAGGLRKI